MTYWSVGGAHWSSARADGGTLPLSPADEEELSRAILRDQVGVDPRHLTPVLELAALGLINAAWRNTAVENWHAQGRLHDGDMLRINSHSTCITVAVSR